MKNKILTIGLVSLMILLTGCNSNKNAANFETKTANEMTYYIIKDEYKGNYNLQIKEFKKEMEFSEDENRYVDFDTQEQMTYDEYEKFCKEWELEQKYTDKNKKYIVMSYISYYCDSAEAKLCDVKENENKVTLYVWDNFESQRFMTGSMEGGIWGYSIIIPIDKEYKEVNVEVTITNEEFKQIKDNPEMYYVDKPVIYIYPEKEMNISVKLKNSDRLTCSYPKYNNGWDVIAKPDGSLLYNEKSLYCLYYENKPIKPFRMTNEGFIVKGENSTQFLEEKLEILGLNEKEAQEFIIYWLPKLEVNKYNYIRFANDNEINENMGLEISPKPDTTIRILMTFKGLDKPINVKEQKLENIKRDGFSVVEWGGTEIK
ncbi:hypothetical protein [Thomasclavelia cocleata]|uniref:hypothetical protein n=1 Tax=Thomasclavelia cocleata TaxID=69824 RepID=UPI00256EA45C|nr:hypothetical protein [Thomasclavelia cocleata]